MKENKRVTCLVCSPPCPRPQPRGGGRAPLPPAPPCLPRPGPVEPALPRDTAHREGVTVLAVRWRWDAQPGKFGVLPRPGRPSLAAATVSEVRSVLRTSPRHL